MCFCFHFLKPFVHGKWFCMFYFTLSDSSTEENRCVVTGSQSDLRIQVLHSSKTQVKCVVVLILYTSYWIIDAHTPHSAAFVPPVDWTQVIFDTECVQSPTSALNAGQMHESDS